jgi:nicotinamide mononucleotide transporter
MMIIGHRVAILAPASTIFSLYEQVDEWPTWDPDTKADLPYVDAVPAALSMAASWLQARKVLQSWLLFIVANLLFIGIYAVKGLHVTIALYLVSTALAVHGYLAWKATSAQRSTVS